MNIKREKNNFFKGYDYEIIDKDKKLRIIYAGNLDLYFILVFNNEIPYGKSATRSIKITKENYELYKIFDDLYEEVTNGKIFEDEEASNSISDYLSQRDLVDSNNNICWISDEGPREVEDSMTISKKEDAYNISFERNNDDNGFALKSAYSIGIRICNSGSRYGRYNIPFMRMFQKLQTIDPDIHQIDIEEIIYQKKKA